MWGYQPPPWWGYPSYQPPTAEPKRRKRRYEDSFEEEYNRTLAHMAMLQKIKDDAIKGEKEKSKDKPKSWTDKLDIIHVTLFFLLMSPFIGYMMNKLTEIVSH